MKKIIFLLLLVFVFGINCYAKDDVLYDVIKIPYIEPVTVPKEIIIEKNDVTQSLQEIGEGEVKRANTDELTTKDEGNIYYPIINMLGKYKNKIQTIYTDIDGIILKENGNTNDFKDDINKTFSKLKENNISVILTTNRTFREAKRIAEYLEIDPEYYIVENGAEIVTANGDVIYNKPINALHVFKISEELKWFNYHYTQNLRLAYYGRGKVYIRRGAEIPNLVDIPVVMDKFLDLPNGIKISKIRIYAKDDNSLDIFKRYMAKFYKRTLNVNKITSNYIDINMKNATKENAVEYLSGIIGTDLSNSAAFGYSQADIGLMNLLRENGGLAISMENSFQDVKDVSSYMTKDLDREGFDFAVNTILGNNLLLNSEK